MQYNQPLDQPSNPNAPYIDGNPGAGIQGSIVPAASIEYDQREVVEVIYRAFQRGYSDFSNTPCAAPFNSDLMQLRKAIEGFVKSLYINVYIIDTEVTYKVHGPGADFTDLIAAFNWLGRYKITPTGHVILQLAGAAPGSAAATQYVYSRTIVIDHPNNDRISIFGAPMLAPVPRLDSSYYWSGPTSTQRANDTAANLAMLRTKFATELHWAGVIVTGTSYPAAAIRILGLSLMHMDGLLITSDGGPYLGTGVLFNCGGYMNNFPRSITGPSSYAYDGLAVVNFPYAAGFQFDTGAGLAVAGENSQNTCTPLISIGNASGISLTNGGFVTTAGNAICLSNNGPGFVLWPRSGESPKANSKVRARRNDPKDEVMLSSVTSDDYRCV